MSTSPAKPQKTHCETGQVARLEGQIAVVTVSKASACEGCPTRRVCHSLSGSDERELRAVNPIGAAPGDRVEIAIPTTAGLRAAVWVYLVPTVLLVVVALGSHRLASLSLGPEAQDLVAAMVSLGALGLFVLCAWLWRRRRGPDYRQYPRVIRRL